MASEKTGTPKMIVPYEWILGNVGEEPMTIASKMISFRGEKVFRVGLKNHTKLPVLFLMAIDLGKIGMRVEDVKYGIQSSGIGPAKMTQMINDNIGNGGNLQLFTINLAEKVLGNCTLMFRICIEGTGYFGYSGYSYQLSDRLAKDQFWDALKNQQCLPDVEFVVMDKTFPAHRAILAARSHVFADEFKKKQPGKDGRHQIRIDDVEPSTVNKLLHFVYTGELMGTSSDEDLLKLAHHYQLKTLSVLCQIALEKIEAMQMASIMKCLNSNTEKLSTDDFITMPEKETEIFFDRTTPTFRCSLAFNKKETEQPTCVMKYQNDENICFAYNSNTEIHLTCFKHKRFGLKVEDIYCKHHEGCNQWFKMEPKKFPKNAELLHFAALSHCDVCLEVVSQRVYLYAGFDVKVVSTIGNYYFEMMDDKWLTDFWMAATNQKLTDVEIFVGTVKVMEAHRVILCARSPVLNADLNKISKTAEKSIVTFGAEFDVTIIKNFLSFLYTGSLKTTDSGQKLIRLATMYQVETLKNVCQLIVSASSPDVEELTICLI
ncbi:hypothetical protein DAPPUDRAFT_101112 [Daphnia pulex]|uniref:BTB domain-containing protein n=1 Tax=Daphnia pulex TaxID=6669 RepID=E9GCE3_DAPPU|nr:hypothetical protein DAPPUDRAFT_101112 [Daphnia pulex]|eukprot:EFX82533.1 hypothetical protein DAPPUDRAFT_101112 [Daphnia pulex]